LSSREAARYQLHVETGQSVCVRLCFSDRLWAESVVRLPNGEQQPIKIRSMVRLIPLLAVVAAPAPALERFPGFKRRMEWFIANRPELTGNITSMMSHSQDGRFLMSVLQPEQLRRILRIRLDEQQFLSPYGIRTDQVDTCRCCRG
jgi:hypothetical protein